LDDRGGVVLIASFKTNEWRSKLLERFGPYLPEWTSENDTDWLSATQQNWPSRVIGDRLFLAPVWNHDATPSGRLRIVHNPGLACGTGEHPCTQLALAALEKCVTDECRVVDVGAGSGILSIAALRLGAGTVLSIDTDETAFRTARENFHLNDCKPSLVVGSADCIVDNWSDITVANISGTVLMSILHELMGITRANGWLILTGFPEHELTAFEQLFPDADVTAKGEWRCLAVRLS
jgi:ribosomal protein L11 methyltransferase